MDEPSGSCMEEDLESEVVMLPKELKQIQITIARNNKALKKNVLHPELITPVRRPDEGRRPIFDRPEIKEWYAKQKEERRKLHEDSKASLTDTITEINCSPKKEDIKKKQNDGRSEDHPNGSKLSPKPSTSRNLKRSSSAEERRNRSHSPPYRSRSRSKEHEKRSLKNRERKQSEEKFRDSRYPEDLRRDRNSHEREEEARRRRRRSSEDRYHDRYRKYVKERRGRSKRQPESSSSDEETVKGRVVKVDDNEENTDNEDRALGRNGAGPPMYGRMPFVGPPGRMGFVGPFMGPYMGPYMHPYPFPPFPRPRFMRPMRPPPGKE